MIMVTCKLTVKRNDSEYVGVLVKLMSTNVFYGCSLVKSYSDMEKKRKTMDEVQAYIANLIDGPHLVTKEEARAINEVYAHMTSLLVMVCVVKDITINNTMEALVDALKETRKEVKNGAHFVKDFFINKVYEKYPMPDHYLTGTNSIIWRAYYRPFLNPIFPPLFRNCYMQLNVVNAINRLLNLCYYYQKQEGTSAYDKKISEYSTNEGFVFACCDKTTFKNNEFESARIKRTIRGPKAKCFDFSIHSMQRTKGLHRPNYKEPAKKQAPRTRRWNILQIFKK